VEDLTEQATGWNEKVEAKLRKKYLPIFSSNTYHMKPCTVQDEVGNLMLWYIPGALTATRTVSNLFSWFPFWADSHRGQQMQIWNDMKILQKSLHMKNNCNNWRVGPTHFRVEEGWLKPGSASMSPAWFQQAHEVHSNFESPINFN